MSHWEADEFRVRGDRRRAKRVANYTRKLAVRLMRRGEFTDEQVAILRRVFRREKTLRIMMRSKLG